MYSYYNNLFEAKTKYLDSRIKKIDLYKLSRNMYVNQGKIPCECEVFLPDLIIFKYRMMKNVGFDIKHEVLCKNVIKMQGDYCLTYTEARQFNTKHNLVNLDINVEFMLGEKVNISAFKKDYAVLLKASHFIVDDIGSSYSLLAHVPIVGISNFNVIPFGDIFSGCYPETIEMFEDFYSGYLYNKKIKKL